MKQWIVCAVVFLGCSKTPLVSELSKETENAHEQQFPIQEGAHQTPFTGMACVPAEDDLGWSQGDCPEYLVCMPSIFDFSKGTCRVACGLPETTCPGSETCQLVTSLRFEDVGEFCLPKQSERDGICYAHMDENACSDSRKCAASRLAYKNGHGQADGFVCRDWCTYGYSKGRGCAEGETCFPLDGDEELQTDPNRPKEPQFCIPDNCKRGIHCPCQKEQGYACEPFVMGFHVCKRKNGICADSVSLAHSRDLKEGTFVGATCNETSGHRLCADPLDPLSHQNICVSFRNNGDGVCLRACSIPEMDYNQDGRIGAHEARINMDCPLGDVCRTELGHALGIVALIRDPAKRDAMLSCDPNQCEQNTPCPSECGPGDAECMWASAHGKIGFYCAAPLGNCESQSN